MTYTKTKSERIPIGDGYLPDVSEAELEEMIAAILSCQNIPKELLILSAILKRCSGISAIPRDLSRPYATIHGWLLRVHERGADGR